GGPTERMPTMPSRAALIAALALFSAGPMASQSSPDLAAYLIDRGAEVALARTAAPRNVSDPARVLVLTRDGYVEAAPGTNGFTCLVVRSFDVPVTDPRFWNPRIRAPHCFNPAGARTVLPQMLKRAEWVMSGVSPTEIGERTRRAYAAREFPMPAGGAMAYMMSPQQYLQDGDPHYWMPHLMFYFDRSMSAADWGAGGEAAAVIDGSADDPSSPVLTLLVP